MTRKIEVDFQIPVELTDDDCRLLDRLVDRICKRNCPDGWVFWPSGSGDKPSFSAVDARLLGVEADPSIPDGDEPRFDDSIYHVHCCAREAWPEEIERNRLRAERKAKADAAWDRRLERWLKEKGLRRTAWLFGDFVDHVRVWRNR